MILNTTFRWVTAHRTCLIKVDNNYEILIPFMEYVAEHPEIFRKGGVDQANSIRGFWIARNVKLLVTFMIDALEGFQAQSLLYQRLDQSSKCIQACQSKILSFKSNNYLSDLFA